MGKCLHQVYMQSSPRYLIIPDRGRKDILALISLSSKTLRTITNTLRSQDALKAEEPRLWIR